MKVRDVRARHIKGCMDDGTAVVKGKEQKSSAGNKSRMKSVFNLMLDYAVEYELVDRNYARTFNVSDEIVKEASDAKRSHLSFTDEEMDILWKNVDTCNYVNIVLIQCYGGWRPQELGLIELKNVDLSSYTLIGGMKTDAGFDRVVPIHSKIRYLVEKLYEEAVSLGSKYLINCTDSTTHRGNMMLTYDKYQKRFGRIRDELKLNPDHRAHDGRKQFVTMAKKFGVDEYAIKYIVGHAINDITEKVYTDRQTDWLKTEIEKIK